MLAVTALSLYLLGPGGSPGFGRPPAFLIVSEGSIRVQRPTPVSVRHGPCLSLSIVYEPEGRLCIPTVSAWIFDGILKILSGGWRQTLQEFLILSGSCWVHRAIDGTRELTWRDASIHGKIWPRLNLIDWSRVGDPLPETVNRHLYIPKNCIHFRFYASAHDIQSK